MPKINLTTEPRFKGLLKDIGFRKREGQFVRNYRESVQELDFGYGSKNEKHVRYYDCLCAVKFPQIDDFASELDIFTYGCYGQIGYMMPQHTFVEWRLAEDDTDEYYREMILDIQHAVKEYAMPYLSRYSTLQEFVWGAEKKEFHNSFDPKAVPIAYYLLGEEECAIDYMLSRLRRLDNYENYNHDMEFVNSVYSIPPIAETKSSGYIDYLNFAEKLINGVSFKVNCDEILKRIKEIR